MVVKPIPDGYHSVTPYLTVQGTPKLIDFVKQAFDLKEIERFTRPDGTIGHAEVRIGDSVIMMAEATSQWMPMPSAIYLYVNDTDATYRRALQAGATSIMGASGSVLWGPQWGRQRPSREPLVDRNP